MTPRQYFKRSPILSSFPEDFQQIGIGNIRLQDGRHYSNKRSSNGTEILCSSFGYFGYFVVPKILKCELSGPLETIFNTSFLTGIVPEKFKMARVIPIFKKGSQTSLNNYRPISLLSVFNKLLEKLMYKRIIDFVNKRQVIYSKQFGFCNHYSTEYAVLSIIDQVQLAIESHDSSCGIFLDFSKAFDTVNHQILLTKLDYYGIRVVVKDWFTS